MELMCFEWPGQMGERAFFDGANIELYLLFIFLLRHVDPIFNS